MKTHVQKGDEPTDEPFGLRFYNEARRLGVPSTLTWGLGFDEIQRLKVAGRDEVIGRFTRTDYATAQLLKSGTPEDLAVVVHARMQRQQQRQERARFSNFFLGWK